MESKIINIEYDTDKKIGTAYCLECKREFEFFPDTLRGMSFTGKRLAVTCPRCHNR